MNKFYHDNSEVRAPLGASKVKGDASYAEVGMENQLGFKKNFDREK